MDDREPLDVAQQLPLFRVEYATTSAKKGHLIAFVTVMSHCCLIPRETILFVQVFAHVACSFLSFLEHLAANVPSRLCSLTHHPIRETQHLFLLLDGLFRLRQ